MLRKASVLAVAASFALMVGCAPPNDIEEASGSTTSATTEPSVDEGDGCDPAASRARLEATFERSVDCAADAMGVGLANKLKLAGEAVKDTKRVVDTIKRLSGSIRVRNLSSARAVLCVRAVTDIMTEQAGKAAVATAAQGLTEGEIDELYSQAAGTFSFGVSNVFANAGKAFEEPNWENVVEFLASFAESGAHMGEFVTTCGSLLAEFGVVSLPAISRYASSFGTLCVASGIVSCSSALIGNSADVLKEFSCLQKDLQRIAEQEATLQRMNDARCTNLATLADNPAALPLINASGNTSDARRSACSEAIRYWGSCVYDAKRSGFFGSTALTCGECERVCNGYVNGAGPNAYLQPVIDGALDRAGGDATKVRRLVQQAALSCGANVSPDQLKPCINFCRGQVADCP